MDSLVGLFTGSVVSSAIELITNVDDEDDGVTVDQTVGIGILKSYNTLFPEFDVDYSSFARDFETLLHAGFSTNEANKMVCLIYFPRTYLVIQDIYGEEFVNELSDDQVIMLVNNCLIEFLNASGISVEHDLEYDIGAYEKKEARTDLFE